MLLTGCYWRKQATDPQKSFFFWEYLMWSSTTIPYTQSLFAVLQIFWSVCLRIFCDIYHFSFIFVSFVYNAKYRSKQTIISDKLTVSIFFLKI